MMKAYLTWCRQLARLQEVCQTYFSKAGFAPFFSDILQPTIGFDPTNRVYCLANADRDAKYLRTSPERTMKIALAVTHTSLFEMGKVFRGGPDNCTGPLHANEFWMCEWYEMHADLVQGISRTKDFLHHIWQEFVPEQIFHWELWTFDDLFKETTGLDLTSWLRERSQAAALSELDYWYADRANPFLTKRNGFVTICLFPYMLSALAKMHTPTASDDSTRHRFERWETSYRGIELLNGYGEIEQWDTLTSHVGGQIHYQDHTKNSGPLWDKDFEKGLQNGLPACTGCALGLDRLLMVLLGHAEIQTSLTHIIPS